MNLMEESKMEKKIININENVIVINDIVKDNTEKNYHVSLVIKDDSSIRHSIKISIESMKDGQIKIPSEIMIETGIINNHYSKHVLLMKQTYDNIELSYDGILTSIEKLNASDINSDKIIEIIINYLNSFSDLNNNIHLKKGLEVINSSLKAAIDYILSFWKNFDLNSYIKQQEAIIQGYKEDYLRKVQPIKENIKLLQFLQEEKSKTK